MASAVVSYLLKKLDDVLIQEILFLYGVGEKVEAMKRELERIRCFLKDADAKRNVNDGVKRWVHDVRQVAFKIEDAIDTFMADVANIDHEESPEPSSNKCLCICINKMFKKSAKLPALHKLGTELDDIKSVIDEISKSKSTYVISDLGEGCSQVRRPFRPDIIPEIDDLEVVGFHTDKMIITEQLLNKTITKLSVISIVGQGGLGKTTLALKVYNSPEVKRNFNIQIWLSISQEFQLENLLKKMLKKIQPTIKQEVLDKLDKEELFIKLNMSLQKKKYLIVMDDVWTNDLWTQIIQAFPDLKNGSRILITTRIVSVAKATDPTREPYQLPFLNENDSFELFIKNGISRKECPIDLLELAKHFVEKCGGLPLALEILGKYLSIKPPTYHDWNRVFKQMNWRAVGENGMDIIAMSFENLPPVLKTCFEYFALFPEDYKIEVKSLIRMWVAEGFIAEEANQTMEETAKYFLEELVDRSMVQVAKRNYNGSIKYCRIHDMLRDVAIEKAKEDDFLTVFSNPDNLTGSDTVRRAALPYPLSDQWVEATNPCLRSVFCNDSIQNCSRFKLLRTFNQFGRHIINVDSFAVSSTQMRYFGVMGLFYDLKFISCMKSLQTIDLKTTTAKVPDSLWDVKTLRHVILARSSECSPSPSTNLKNLQTLYKLVVQNSWGGNLPYLPNIREIEIDTRQVDVEYGSRVVADFVTRSKNLVHLTINSKPLEGFNFFEMSALKQIEILVIYGFLSSGMLKFDVNLFPVHLIQLKLDGFLLKIDPMPILGKLKNLKKLELSIVYEGFRMTCLAGDFCQLKKLVMMSMGKVKEWKIEINAFPKLKKLKVVYCYFVIDGLHHLTTLREVEWWIPGKFGGRKRFRREEKIRNMFKLVPSITFR